MHTDWKSPPWPISTVTICMSCFMTGDPDKEYGTNKPPPTWRVWERSKGDTACPSTSQNPSRLHPSWLSDACATRKDSEFEWLSKDHPETNPITIKPKTVSHAAEQFSWVPLPSCSPPGCPFPIKSLALLARVSSDNSFLSVRQEPSFGPWKGSPFLQHSWASMVTPVNRVAKSGTQLNQLSMHVSLFWEIGPQDLQLSKQETKILPVRPGVLVK